MNKKQKIVLVVVGVLLYFIVLGTPKKFIYAYPKGARDFRNKPKVVQTDRGLQPRPILLWDFAMQRALLVLIPAGVIMLFLKGKK